jgi:gliding motility-associated-like protein
VTLTVTNSCGINSTTESFNVFPLPTLPNLNAQGNPYCATETIKLRANNPPNNISYNWEFEDGTFIDSIRNVNIGNATTAMSGWYILTITDNATGCENTDSVQVNVTDLPIITIAGDTSICSGESTTLIASGASTYTWFSSNGGNPITGANPNVSPSAHTTYTVEGTDINGCINIDTTMVIVNNLPTVYAGQDQTVCITTNTNLQTGASANPAGGTYYWTGQNVNSSGIFNSSNSGLFTSMLYYMDLNGCEDSSSVNITVIGNANLQAFPYDTVCAYDNIFLFDNTTFTPTNGATWYGIGVVNSVTGEYDPSIIGNTIPVGGSGVTDMIIMEVGTGICQTFDTTYIFIAPIPAVSIGNNISTCTNSPSITLSGTPLGGTWSGNGVNQQGIFEPSIAGTGTHILYYNYTSLSSCFNLDSLIVTVFASNSNIDIGNDTIICTGTNITLNVGSSVGSYNWSTGATSSTIQVGAGTYAVTVANGICIVTDSILITETQPNINIIQSDTALCSGDGTGAVIGVPVINTNLYTYSWDNGSQADIALNLNSGLYSVTVTDINNCQIIENINIVEPTILMANPSTISDVTCNGANNGSVSATVSGGTIPYQYNWSNSSNANIINNISGGWYLVTVTDVNGCTDIDSILVNEPMALDVVINTITNIDCNGNNNGSISTTISGGIGNYSYFWSNNIATATNSNLVAGNYTITVTDANNCTDTVSGIIQEPNPIITNLTLDAAIKCNGGNDGEASITVTGGVPNYNISWTNGGSGTQNTSLSVGWQYVVVLDANSCLVTDSIFMTEPTVITATTTTLPDSCDGQLGTMSVQSSGGTTPYSYGWTPPVGNNNAVSGLDAGTYTVTITDANNCILIINDNVGNFCDSCTLLQPITSVKSNDFEYNCFGSGLAEVQIMLQGGKPQYDGFSDYELTISGSSLASGTLFSQNGEFTFDIQDGDNWNVSVVDDFGCMVFQTGGSFTEDTSDCSNYCNLYPVSVQTFGDTIMLTYQTMQITSQSTGQSVSWFPTTALSCSNCLNPIASPQLTTAYTITASNPDGCDASETFTIIVLDTPQPDSIIPPPTIFSPDGDGVDDNLVIQGANLVPRNTLYVVNRWGQVVFTQEQYDNTWDGTIKGVLLPQDTYYYFLKTDPPTKNPLMGSILLIRKQ